MCLKCDAPSDRYYVRDGATGLLVCEECGFAVTQVSREALEKGDYIWLLNPQWPEFHSFEDLLAIMLRQDREMPAFYQYGMYPSRVLTALLDFLFQGRSGAEDA